MYKTASKIEPENVKILVFIANTYLLLENYENTVKYYRKAMKIAPKDNEIKLIYLDMMDKYIKNKKKEKNEK